MCVCVHGWAWVRQMMWRWTSTSRRQRGWLRRSWRVLRTRRRGRRPCWPCTHAMHTSFASSRHTRTHAHTHSDARTCGRRVCGCVPIHACACLCQSHPESRYSYSAYPRQDTMRTQTDRQNVRVCVLVYVYVNVSGASVTRSIHHGRGVVRGAAGAVGGGRGGPVWPGVPGRGRGPPQHW
jgi:hypothetical protein